MLPARRRRLPRGRARRPARALAWALAWSVCTVGAAAPPSAPVHRVVTVLDEVKTGSVDGLGYLVIAIGAQPVGPLRCRGRVLRIDATDGAAPARLTSMEQVALAAMLNADTVLVTVPLAPEACRDGRPTFTRLELLPASP